MEINYVYALASVIIVSLVSFIGLATLSVKEERIKKGVFFMVSLAVGALLGDAFIHLIPEAFEQAANSFIISLLIIAGMLLFFLLEKAFHWHHHGEDSDETHIHHSGKMVLVSDGLHNFIDGIVLASSYMISIEVGIATTIAIILHEIPQEIGDFGVLIHAGYSRARALLLNFVSALSAVLGVIVALLVGNSAEAISVWFLPVAAGGFIYIAAADLIPELHQAKGGRQIALQFVAIMIGIAAMALLVLVE